MKKLGLTFALLCTLTTVVKGQFFGQRKYPGACATSITDAKLTQIHSNGYVMGFRRYGGCSAKAFGVRKTNADGYFSSPDDFLVDYQILLNPVCSSTPTFIAVDSYGTSVIETGTSSTPVSGSRYAVVTSYYESSCGYGCVFVTIDQIGNLVTKACYQFPSSTTSAGRPIITESSTLGTYYIAGSYVDGGIEYAYVLSVNASGVINWSNIYQAGLKLIPNGIIESPYNSSDLILIGECDPDPTLPPMLNRANDGFFLKLTSSGGGVTTFTCYGDDPQPGLGTCNLFSCISIAQSPHGGGAGYVVGGLSDPYSLSANQYGHSWVLKLDQNGGIIWSTLIQGSSFYNNAAEVTGVIERFNTLGAYEYYCTTSSGSAGQNTVFKLDDSGSLMSGVNNEFAYTAAGGGADPVSITDINTGSSNDGFQIFVTDQNTFTDGYFVKAYFDGNSGCNESLTNINTCETFPSSIISPVISPSSGLTLYTCTGFDVTQPSLSYTSWPNSSFYSTYCGATSISGASNARAIYASVLNSSTSMDQFQIAPNPTSGNLNIKISKASKTQRVLLYNSLGELISEIPILNKEYEIDFDLKKFDLESGIYFIHFVSGKERSVQKIVYSK